MKGAASVVAVGLVTLGLAACKPSLQDTVSIITSPRVLAIRSESDGGAAELAGGETFTMTGLYVDSTGVVSPSPLRWAFCDQPKPLAELGPVSSGCLAFGGDAFVPLGLGDQVLAQMPTMACQNFGPEAVMPQQRPVDPDGTGGYYQPVQVVAPGATGPAITLGETRIVCTLASPSQDVRDAFGVEYQRNRNPSVLAFGIADGSPWVATSVDVAPTNLVGVGQHVTLRVAWRGPSEGADGGAAPDASTATYCLPPVTLDGGGQAIYAPCDGAEHYLLLDTASQTLVDRREAIAVAWYATAGAFDVDRTGRAGEDLVATSDNGWQAPSVAGRVIMWIVLRDERGGAGWQQYAIDVQ